MGFIIGDAIPIRYYQGATGKTVKATVVDESDGIFGAELTLVENAVLNAAGFPGFYEHTFTPDAAGDWKVLIYYDSVKVGQVFYKVGGGLTVQEKADVSTEAVAALLTLRTALINANTVFTSSAATVNTVTCAALVDRVDLYEGMMLVPLDGDQAGQGRYITAYDDSDILTVSPDWGTDPDAAGNFTFVVMPTPARFLYEAGKGLEAIFDIVDGIPVLTRVGGTHDQSDAAGTEDTVVIYDALGANWKPDTFDLDLTEMVALDDIRLRIYYRVVAAGDWLKNVDENYNGVPMNALLSFPLNPNRFGTKITLAQNAGTVRDYLWELYSGES